MISKTLFSGRFQTRKKANSECDEGYSLSQYREGGCSRIWGGVVRAGLFKRGRAECSRKSKKQAKRRKR